MDVTIKDIARACGVNVSTVSRALSGSYGVNDETRRKVLEAAAKLNYRPNRVARAMATGKSHTLALIISDIRNPFFADVARGAEDAAYAAGCDLVLCNSDLNPAKQMQYLRSLVEKRVDGIVVNSVAALSREERAELASYGVKFVLLNRVGGSRDFSTVVADNEEGGRLAGRHLSELGHIRLAHTTGPNAQGNLNDRTRGFLKAAASSGLPDPVVLRGEHSLAGGYDLAKRVLERHARVTAMFAANDAMAFGALHALMDAGRRVPEDMSLVGFDNVDLSAITSPPLTTIHQPKYEMGKAAIEMLLAGNGQPHVCEHRVLGVRLVERQSCRRI